MSERRIAAYGGTFDPLHNGHLEIARLVVRRVALDELLVIPAHRPPHKTGQAISTGYHRYGMAVLATLDEPRIRVSTLELEAPNKPYTFETIERLCSVYGSQTDLFFVMGADSFEEIHTWREPARILANASLIVVARPGYQLQTVHLPALSTAQVLDRRGTSGEIREAGTGAGRIYFIDCEMPVSATDIRERVSKGAAIDHLVPPRVAQYISRYALYQR
jgi:nicotinate-nucleotide adenylyltransferase